MLAVSQNLLAAKVLAMTNEQALVKRVEVLTKALEGIASCATQCLCCEMHRNIAVKALGYEVEIITEIPA